MSDTPLSAASAKTGVDASSNTTPPGPTKLTAQPSLATSLDKEAFSLQWIATCLMDTSEYPLRIHKLAGPNGVEDSVRRMMRMLEEIDNMMAEHKV